MRHDEHYTPGYRRAGSWRPFAFIIGLCVALVFLVVLVGQLRAALDPQARAMAEAERYRQLQLAERLDWLDTVLAAGWRVLPLAAAGGLAWVSILALYNRLARYDTTRADKVIALQRASTQRFPAGLQSLSFHDSSRQLAPEHADEAPLQLQAAPVPTFGELLQRGDIGPGKRLCLGYTEAGAPLHGSWLDLYSTAVGGLPGSGKTTSQRFFASQAALMNARFVVVDKHAEAADDSLAATLEPLSSLYICEPASTEASILAAVRLVADIGERRISGRDTSREPLLLWIDEATALLAHSKIGPELAALLETIAQQYRKRWIYASISGQLWAASRTGGDTGLRDSLASVLAHRMKRTQARMLVPTDEAGLVERLEPGRALLWRTSGASEVVTIPNCTAADVRTVAGLLTGSQPTMQRLRTAPPPSHAGATLEPHWSPNGAGSSAVQRGEPLSADVARVLGLFRQGADIPKIVFELYGVSSSSGSAYQKKSAEVQALLRLALATHVHE